MRAASRAMLALALGAVAACESASPTTPGFLVSYAGFTQRLADEGFACVEARRLLSGFRSASCDRTTETGGRIFLFVYGRQDGSFAGFDLIEDLLPAESGGPRVVRLLRSYLTGTVDGATADAILAGIGEGPSLASGPPVPGGLVARWRASGSGSGAVQVLSPDLAAVWGRPPAGGPASS